jgi:hypothetical protein
MLPLIPPQANEQPAEYERSRDGCIDFHAGYKSLSESWRSKIRAALSSYHPRAGLVVVVDFVFTSYLSERK